MSKACCTGRVLFELLFVSCLKAMTTHFMIIVMILFSHPVFGLGKAKAG